MESSIPDYLTALISTVAVCGRQIRRQPLICLRCCRWRFLLPIVSGFTNSWRCYCRPSLAVLLRPLHNQRFDLLVNLSRRSGTPHLQTTSGALSQLLGTLILK